MQLSLFLSLEYTVGDGDARVSELPAYRAICIMDYATPDKFVSK